MKSLNPCLVIRKMKKVGLLIILTVVIGICQCQLYGGTDGPCSASPIQSPYDLKPITVFGSSVGARPYLDDACLPSPSGVVWYTIQVASTPTNFSLSTCAQGTTFNTILAVYRGVSCNTLYCADANDNDPNCTFNSYASYLTFFPNVAFQTYWIAVSGSSTTEGSFQLTISQSDYTVPPPPGCSAAVAVHGPYYPELTVYGSTVNGARGFENYDCAIGPNQIIVWYQIFPVQGTKISITTCNPATNFDTVITIFEGSTCSNVTCAIHNDDTHCSAYFSNASSLSFVPTSSSYFVVLGGYANMETGTYQISFLQNTTAPNKLK